MITESINNPDPFARWPATRTTMRLGCPPRAMLLVIIATIVWGNPRSSWSAWITSAGRRFDVRRFESGNKDQNDVTAAVPEIVEAVRGFPVHTVVLDGEAIAFDASGRPHPFQITMRRFGRKLNVAALREELPIGAFFLTVCGSISKVLRIARPASGSRRSPGSCRPLRECRDW